MRYLKYYLMLSCVLFCYLCVLRAQTPLASANVKVYFTARENNKSPVATLNKEDLVLLEDGVPRLVTELEGPEEVAVNVSLLIDVSPSWTHNLSNVKKAALSLVHSTARPGKNTALVATFTDGVKVEQGPSADLQKLQTAIESLETWQQSRDSTGRQVVGNPNTLGPTTGIWDAVWTTCEYILPQTDQRARHIIVVVTDGEDISSKKTPEEAAARAIRSNAVVYAVRFRKEKVYSANFMIEMAQRNSQLDSWLAELTKPTGGQVYSVKDEKGLETAIAQVASEIRGQYRITFTPTSDGPKGRFRKLELRTAPGKQGVKVNMAHQNGYYVDTPK